MRMLSAAWFFGIAREHKRSCRCSVTRWQPRPRRSAETGLVQEQRLDYSSSASDVQPGRAVIRASQFLMVGSGVALPSADNPLVRRAKVLFLAGCRPSLTPFQVVVVRQSRTTTT